MLAFIVNQFPRQVDAYFLRELVGLAERGLDYRIFSLLPAPTGWKVHADAKTLLDRTTYPPKPLAAAAAVARGLRRAPRVSARTIAEIVSGHRSQPTALAKSLAIIPSAYALAEQMQRLGVDHIHANWATYPATAALLISRLTGIPYSFTGHATDIFVHRAMLPEKIRGAEFVVTCTQYNQSYLAALAGPAPAKVRAVYHGVDLQRFERNGTRSEPDLVLCVGTLRACKGLEELIEAIAILRQRGRSERLEVIGEGEERPKLEALARELGVADRVALVGYRPQEEVATAYRRARVVALPAHSEDHFGIPNILIEGLAARTPVVCTRLPSLPELIEHGKSGFFVPERDPKALADIIAQIVDDPARADALAEEGYRRVAARFDMRSTVGQLNDMFVAAEAAARNRR